MASSLSAASQAPTRKASPIFLGLTHRWRAVPNYANLLLIEAPEWAQGLPIAAKMFECDRFKKD
jgi:hypothetical protein